MKTSLLCYSASFFLSTLSAIAAPQPEQKTWSDPAIAAREDSDFTTQGEYLTAEKTTPWGAQVVALGNGKFAVYLLEGGLPGAGWKAGMSRTLLNGERKGDQIACADNSGNITATIAKEQLSLTASDGTKHLLTRIERKSPTLEAKPPTGAIVLFDGKSAEMWENGKSENGHLLATGCTTKQQFGSYQLHAEFRTPYTPTARGQQRGNSGIYHSGRWETQILDSFGLDGKDNECGGIYSISPPQLNMALPPLAWQTYDVDFTAATFDSAGKRTAWPKITVKLNGVVIHESLELAKDFTTSAPLSKALATPEGPIHLQNHGNPVVFRNIWIVSASTK